MGCACVDLAGSYPEKIYINRRPIQEAYLFHILGESHSISDEFRESALNTVATIMRRSSQLLLVAENDRFEGRVDLKVD